MQTFSLRLVFLCALAAFIPLESHALVRQLADCTTADGHYRILVLGNQGIGFDRSERISASIVEESGRLLAAYHEVELYKGPRSISFGRPHYQDIATQGGRFLLEGPSTNYRHYSVHAETPAGLLADDNLRCAVFLGRLQE